MISWFVYLGNPWLKRGDAFHLGIGGGTFLFMGAYGDGGSISFRDFTMFYFEINNIRRIYILKNID